MRDTRHIRQFIEKRAGVGADFAGGMVGSAIPVVGFAANAAGNIGSLVAPAPKLETLNQYDKNYLMSIIPGVGAWRLGRRRKALRKALKSPDSAFNIKWSEELGPSATIIGASAVNPGLGAISILANAGGALVAAMTPRRTLAQQQEYENSMLASVLNTTVPGVGLYNKFKSLGATRNLAGKDEEQVAQELEEEKSEIARKEKEDEDKKNEKEQTEKESAAKPRTSKPSQKDLPPAQRGEPKAISGAKAGINPWVTLSNALGKTSPKVQSLLGYSNVDTAPQLKQPERFTFRASTGKAPVPEASTKLV